MMVTNMQIDRINSERRKSIKDTLNLLLQRRNCENILEEIHIIDNDINSKKKHIEDLEKE